MRPKKLRKLPEQAYTIRRQIRFSHSDPAGIVFFAEFFRMFNDLFEDWLENCLGINFARQFQVEERMFPLVHVNADFKEARKMGQKLDLTLLVTKLGKSSIAYDIIGHDGYLEILSASFVTCVASKRTMKSTEIPDEIRAKIEEYMERCAPNAKRS